MTLGDIYYVLFRHKWKIAVCVVLGIIAAVFAYFVQQKSPTYISEARLFVRYVLTESRSLAAGDATAKSPDRAGETIMSSEVEILTSADLASEVAEAVGAEKILGKNPEKGMSAAALIRSKLVVYAPPFSSVIRVSFSHSDPDVVQPVVRETVNRYLKRHQEIHRGSGFAADFLAQETDQLRTRLSQTEEDLHKMRNKVGVISIEDALKSHSQQLAKIRQEIFNAQAELAERKSIYEEFSKQVPGQATAAPEKDSAPPPPIEAIDELRNIQSRLAHLQETQQNLAGLYTAENARVKEVKAEIAKTEETRRKLLAQHPNLLRAAPAAPVITAPGSTKESAFDPASSLAQINALLAKIKVLTAQYDEVRADAAKIDQIEGQIHELLRKKALDEANYQQYAANLERSRINQAMGDGRVSNITEIQTPSLPMLEKSKDSKTVAGIAIGGLVAGLAWAFLIEMYFDRSIKRPADLDRMLAPPLFITIPNRVEPKTKSPRRKWWRPRLRLKFWKKVPPTPPLPAVPAATSEPSAPATEVFPVAQEHSLALMPYFETLRDRLIAFFESKNLRHKPKLVAVTGLGTNSGVTTVAAGLARSLSEIGEGNVLLVDLTTGQGSAQHFLMGRAVCGLDELLESRSQANVSENLFVVTEHNVSSDQLSRNFPQRFTKLVPKLKASNFDYIIFDMPAVSQISITPRLATFMDMVLVTVESEKTNRDVFQRATALLDGSKSHVGVVLNKMRSYVPKALHQELIPTT
jgi:succinoglycan biosynthesis transport protein ExoP